CREKNPHFQSKKSSPCVARERVDSKMHAFFGMHSTDKKYDFIAIANRRWRRIDHSRSCHWIGNGRDPVCEPRCLRCNHMCDSMRWRLQSRRFAIKTHLPFWIAPDMHVNFAALRIA